MQSSSAPEGDGSRPTIALSRAEQPDDDALRLLLDGPPYPIRQLVLRDWLGIAGLVAAIAVAAFVVPPLVIPSDRPPAPQGLTSAHSPSDQSPAAVNEPSSATASTSLSATGSSSAPHSARSSPKRQTQTQTPLQTQSAKSGRALDDGSTAPTFGPITVQAEAASLSEGAEEIDCATCEAGARVRFVGRVDVHATVPSAGTYRITVVYEVNGDRTLEVSVNDGPPVATRDVTGSDWATPQSFTVSAGLPAGSIDIGLFSPDGDAPDIDAVTIS